MSCRLQICMLAEVHGVCSQGEPGLHWHARTTPALSRKSTCSLCLIYSKGMQGPRVSGSRVMKRPGCLCRWEWESFKAGETRRGRRAGKAGAAGRPSVSAPASPRFATIQHFLDNRDQHAEEAAASAEQLEHGQAAEQAASQQQPQSGDRAGSSSDGSPGWTARAISTALSQSIVGQDCRYTHPKAMCASHLHFCQSISACCSACRALQDFTFPLRQFC